MRINRIKLAVAMIEQDINGSKLAEKAGVSKNTVAAVRCGKSCSERTARKLAEVLGRGILEVESA